MRGDGARAEPVVIVARAGRVIELPVSMLEERALRLRTASGRFPGRPDLSRMPTLWRTAARRLFRT